MEGSFYLTLDTTGPDITVCMPAYATPDVDNEIIVQGSETLAPWQDFYFIDGAGTRHDFIFAYEGDRFVGLVRFNQFAYGVATLHAQVRDEVYNWSPLVTKSINVIKSAHMTICTGTAVRLIDTSWMTRAVAVGRVTRDVATAARAREIETGRMVRQIEVRTA